MRMMFHRIVFQAGFVVLIIALGIYQIFLGGYFLEKAKGNYIRVVPLRSKRGVVLDRWGTPLAYDTASFNIAVIPYQIKKSKEQLFRAIAGEMAVHEISLYRAYSKNMVNPFSPVDILTGVSKEKAFILADKFSDVVINPQPKRFYPYPYETAHLLGYVKKSDSFYQEFHTYGYAPSEFRGVSGVEEYYDAYLKGVDGGDLIEINARGRLVGYLGKNPPRKGKDISLTIDIRLQRLAYEALENHAGSFIMMDVHTGEIVCLANFPSFDPNQFITNKGVGSLLMDQRHPLLNRAIQSAYQIGSTAKPLVALAALEAGKSSPATSYRCTGVFSLGAARFKCMHVHLEENLYDALTHSCNIYFYNLGLLVGPEAISSMMKRFGMHSLTGIDLPYERKGFIPSPEWKQSALRSSWFGGDTCNLSIGQGAVQVTPIENLIAINVFASGGYLVRPHVLKRVEMDPVPVEMEAHLNIAAKNLDIVKRGLTAVVQADDGTARMLKKLRYLCAGKTGTAQAGNKAAHGWFVGYFPYDNPRYSFCVFLEHGESSYFAVKSAFMFLKNARQLGIFNEQGELVEPGKEVSAVWEGGAS